MGCRSPCRHAAHRAATIVGILPAAAEPTPEQTQQRPASPPLGMAEFRGRGRRAADARGDRRRPAIGAPPRGDGSADERGELILVVGNGADSGDDELRSDVADRSAQLSRPAFRWRWRTSEPTDFRARPAGLRRSRRSCSTASIPESLRPGAARRAAGVRARRRHRRAVPRRSSAVAAAAALARAAAARHASSERARRTRSRRRPIGGPRAEAARADARSSKRSKRGGAAACCCATAITCTSPLSRSGSGKIVFTSFPINALDQSQPQVALLWEQLLGAAPAAVGLERDSQLGEARHEVARRR